MKIQKLLNSKFFLLISVSLLATVIASDAIVSGIRDNTTAKRKSPIAVKLAVARSQSATDVQDRLLLAADLINRKQGEQALANLAGLEEQHHLLAAHILFSQGEAHQLEGNEQEATTTWQKLITQHPTSAASAEALYRLGKSDASYWQQAIAKFPAHPRTHEIIRDQLKQDSNQPKLMAILVKYTPDGAGVDQMRDRLVKEYADQLTPDDWQAIADSYWLKWDYGKAGKAYKKAPVTARNLYRAARGHHLGNDKVTAKQYYLRLFQQFPNDDYTGWGLRRIASMVGKTEAISYLDSAIEQFPKHAPEALVDKAKYLEALDSPQSADNALQTLLTDYKHSDAAAKYRWDLASKYAQKDDLVTAWQWAQPIVTDNPDSSLAPKAGFWVAKWAAKLNRP
ncbi:MAG: tetratricopeptide repeat protein, partial [Cyanobacteria bacterium P01_A01_bin.83]